MMMRCSKVNVGVRFDAAPRRGHKPQMRPSVIYAADYAGLHAQALGLAEAMGLQPELLPVRARAPWRWVAPQFWPNPVRVAGVADPGNALLLTAGNIGARLGAALRRPGRPAVHVQHPRMDPARFDAVVVNRHDGLQGSNVVVTRTALHRATPERLRAAREVWEPRLAHVRRPLVAVLAGGSNGRFRLDRDVAADLGAKLVAAARAAGAGIALTPSRRTGADATAALQAALEPNGGWVWNGNGENPYFGLLACADLIVVTEDSVSMVSEAAATRVPVLLAPLPGRSGRIRLFNALLEADGRVRPFRGGFESWPVTPVDDTDAAGHQVRRLVGL